MITLVSPVSSFVQYPFGLSSLAVWDTGWTLRTVEYRRNDNHRQFRYLTRDSVFYSEYFLFHFNRELSVAVVLRLQFVQNTFFFPPVSLVFWTSCVTIESEREGGRHWTLWFFVFCLTDVFFAWHPRERASSTTPDLPRCDTRYVRHVYLHTYMYNFTHTYENTHTNRTYAYTRITYPYMYRIQWKESCSF